MKYYSFISFPPITISLMPCDPILSISFQTSWKVPKVVKFGNFCLLTYAWRQRHGWRTRRGAKCSNKEKVEKIVVSLFFSSSGWQKPHVEVSSNFCQSLRLRWRNTKCLFHCRLHTRYLPLEIESFSRDGYLRFLQKGIAIFPCMCADNGCPDIGPLHAQMEWTSLLIQWKLNGTR